MDRTMIVEHLLQAESTVETGERHVSRQRVIVQRLGDGGVDAIAARELLVCFENLQREHVAHRDWLAKELAALEPG